MKATEAKSLFFHTGQYDDEITFVDSEQEALDTMRDELTMSEGIGGLKNLCYGRILGRVKFSESRSPQFENVKPFLGSDLTFPKHNGAMFISHNEHKTKGQTVEEFTKDGDLGYWFNEGNKEMAIANDSLWILQWSPEVTGEYGLMAFGNLISLLSCAEFLAKQEEGI